MQSKNIHYIEKLDHLRFFAAAIVVLFETFLAVKSVAHPDSFYIPLIKYGQVGVPLFMVISGMILSLIAGEKDIITSKFYLNRILRIYPLFIVIVSLGYFITPDPRPTSTGIDYLMSFLPFSNLYRMQYGMYGGQLWSVAVELQFYLLFPYLLIFKRKYGSQHILGLIIFMVVLKSLIFLNQGNVHQLSYFTIFGNLEIFLVGILIGDYYRTQTAQEKWWHQKWVVPIYFLLINLLLYLVFKNTSFFHVDYAGVTNNGVSMTPLWIIWPALQAMMWGGFILAYLKSKLIPSLPALATLGRYSYSIYVWHQLIIMATSSFAVIMTPYSFGLLVVLPLTVGLSALSYHLIERPFLEMRIKYTISK